ncbi:phenylalanine--tRNA ligase subunit beta [Reyranella sp.]|jgi:phenylalanyl-tRNA synthetase beta chain|uniref:phenylalanine--tRNA ligase subunit beta n=1 Tax=Reyranella sp. TaxID=1929291 RepID=UPI000BD0FEF7|nr:phenylalanine--tRNA ligase subunit beta [Reyranella sp.]OYY33915.1 MAG: phenylalanine--tRNA ligase subunit beta [Rhodospirillales bacterium 35-66-84]OYZ90687.1 MAG: phenylalanine--tRNA ligase subunit beta [Rhodospirillales bacterium 24-66-33]OZB21007.1 MAG: phenylalanine--tRNA ligase subunit beta [Rhodospirillales bacterium 39-66-50]HQS19202.1 phenylalanine--tRNA ligase subunit beta [Reyranella sp.]HQT15473.1 phenylalanine--tRNA ligase subunit beta [Reyranella sp.]
MKFTLSWLKEHLETDATLVQVRDTLTMLGLEVEGLTDPAEALKGFVVGYVVEAVQHPNADRLRVCKVDTGSGTVVQVVCGAPNARTGMKGIFAPTGSYIPGTGITLKASKIRGEESNGMLCSSRELQLGDDHSGIIDLPAETVTGQSAAEALGLGDAVIEIKVTPNRGDCLGVHGIARDLAAAGLGTLKPVKADRNAGSYASPIKWTHDYVPAPDSPCPIVVGRHFRGVKNGPSPDWLQRRLKAIGLRPISTLVDITNLVTFDLNRPLHVFDAAKLSGDLVMRQAREGEQILALDGKTYTLDPAVSVIADAKGVHGIGGIMGGEETGVQESTTEVFLEAAYFQPIGIAASGRKLGILSDARYRNERGIDPESCWWGAEVATRLILDLCGGECSELVSSGVMPTWQRSYTLRTDRVQTLTGIEVSSADTVSILSKLGFGVEGSGPWTAAVPSWRPDIVGEADLVEEVTRVFGFDKIPTTSLPPVSTMSRPVRDPLQRRTPQARRALAARGMNEAVTWSFLPLKKAERFGGGGADVRLLNSIDATLDTMRPSILPNLIDAASRNEARGLSDPALFEVGPQYKDATPQGQRTVAAGIRHNMAVPRNWAGPARTVDAFDAKADALAVLAAVGAPDTLASQAGAPNWYHPGRSGALKLGDRVMAYFGELHPEIVAAADLKGPVAAFEVFLDAPPLPKAKATKARPKLVLSAFQPLERDFAFLVDAGVEAEKLVRAARNADKVMITAARVFDLYAGKGVPEGKKSLAIAVTLQPVERTLTDAEIEAVSDKIVAAVAKATGAVLRG